MKRYTILFADIGFLITKFLKIFEKKIDSNSDLILCVFSGKKTILRFLAGKNF